MENIYNLKTDNGFTISHLEFFPCVKQLTLFESKKNISIDIYENFPKQTLRNRAVVISSQGILNIIVPVNKHGRDKVMTSDIEISYSQNWHVQAWRTVYSCYGKSPYFIYYADRVKEILFKKHKYLMDLNIDAFYFLKGVFHLQCELYLTSDYIETAQDNYRNCFIPKDRIKDGENLKPYYQCCEEKYGFQTNLSALDLLFNLGNQANGYIKNSF